MSAAGDVWVGKCPICGEAKWETELTRGSECWSCFERARKERAICGQDADTQGVVDE